MPNQVAGLDLVFRVLADPTRRAVLERLCRGPASVSELAAPFAMALPSFTQHLGVLEGCGLVRSRKRGRVRTFTIDADALTVAEEWMAARRAEWTQRLDPTSRRV